MEIIKPSRGYILFEKEDIEILKKSYEILDKVYDAMDSESLDEIYSTETNINISEMKELMYNFERFNEIKVDYEFFFSE